MATLSQCCARTSSADGSFQCRHRLCWGAAVRFGGQGWRGGGARVASGVERRLLVGPREALLAPPTNAANTRALCGAAAFGRSVAPAEQANVIKIVNLMI